MKLFIQLEPSLRYVLNPKRARRKSFKWLKRLRNKAIRRFLQNNPDYNSEIVKRVRDWEF